MMYCFHHGMALPVHHVIICCERLLIPFAVVDDHNFKDEGLYYRFYEDEAGVPSGISVCSGGFFF